MFTLSRLPILLYVAVRCLRRQSKHSHIFILSALLGTSTLAVRLNQETQQNTTENKISEYIILQKKTNSYLNRRIVEKQLEKKLREELDKYKVYDSHYTQKELRILKSAAKKVNSSRFDNIKEKPKSKFEDTQKCIQDLENETLKYSDYHEANNQLKSDLEKSLYNYVISKNHNDEEEESLKVIAEIIGYDSIENDFQKRKKINNLNTEERELFFKIKSKNNSKKSLDFSSFSEEINPDVLLKLLQICPDIEILNLRRFQNLTKDILKAIGNLKNLKELDISQCGEISNLDFLENLENLTSLDFSGSDIQDFKSLNKLKSLTSLTTSCEFTDLKNIEDLKNLEVLNLYWSSDIKDFTLLQNFKNLTSLIFNNAPALENLEFLRELSKLKDLSLGSCFWIKDFTPLEACENLVSLNLSFCRIKKIDFLQKLKHLTRLTLSHCKDITDYNTLQFFECLTFLDVSWSNIQDIIFLKNLKLTDLNLENCNVLNFKLLEGFENLTSLNVANNTFNSIAFLKKLNHLKSLNLNWCTKVTDFTLLENFKDLIFLSISKCEKIKDIEFLKNLENLQELHVESLNVIDDNALSIIGNLSELTKLSIFGSKITTLKSLESLKKLKDLNISNCFKILEDESKYSYFKKLGVNITAGETYLK